MADRVLDFRSDTVTKPTPAMREAMNSATVGDDVFGEDPSIHSLEERLAEILGKEAALFVPSGTMSNLVGLRVHCQPGDEFICEAGCHLFNWEQSGYAQIFGIAVRPVVTSDYILRKEYLEDLPRGDRDHEARTRLVCIENTHNRGAGRITPIEVIEEISQWAAENALRTHLDGARLFNAVVATGILAKRWASLFDTVNVCFSKGLGAPVGSALAGDRETIIRARRIRKALGGGMRQAGVVAAGALYALEHQVERLAEDHANARRLGELISANGGLTLSPEQIDTNIVYFEVAKELGSAGEFVKRLAKHGLLMLPLSRTHVRAVTHLDVSAADVEAAGTILRDVCNA
jgi:threonine aldolase